MTPRAGIKAAWDWLEHWGHHVVRVDLDALNVHELFALLDAEQRRVSALAEAWTTWW